MIQHPNPFDPGEVQTPKYLNQKCKYLRSENNKWTANINTILNIKNWRRTALQKCNTVTSYM